MHGVLPACNSLAAEQAGPTCACSGGKDSCYNMMLCQQHGHEIVALANLLPAQPGVDELDSYMFQTVGHQVVELYAECMGLPLLRRRTRGAALQQACHTAIGTTPGRAPGLACLASQQC